MDRDLARKIVGSPNNALLVMVEDGLRLASTFRLPLGTEEDCGGTRRGEIETLLKYYYQVSSVSEVIGISDRGSPLYSRELIIRRT